MFGKYSYLVYMLIFTIIPIVIIWAKEFNYLKKNIKVIAMVVGIAIIYQLIVDPFAEIWKAWFFTKEKTLGIWIINFPIENTIFFILVSVAISSALLAFINYEKTGRLAKRLREFKKLFKKHIR